MVAIEGEVTKTGKSSSVVRRPIPDKQLDFGGDFALVREELDAGEVGGR